MWDSWDFVLVLVEVHQWRLLWNILNGVWLRWWWCCRGTLFSLHTHLLPSLLHSRHFLQPHSHSDFEASFLDGRSSFLYGVVCSQVEAVGIVVDCCQFEVVEIFLNVIKH